MIILIGGTGSVGKTKLAYELMTMLQIPYFSLDILMMGIYRSNPECGYTPMDENTKIAGKIWPITREMIKTNIENGTSGIYEGFQLLPGVANDFSLEYKNQIISYFIAFSNEYIHKHYNEIIMHRSVIEKRDDYDSVEKMEERNKKVIKECKENNQKAFIINEDYVSEINVLIKKIIDEYKELQLTKSST
jgi:2-phosphoglycerate kinase